MKDLRFFIIQFKVRKLYREYMKIIYKSKNFETREELIQTIRNEFEINKMQTNTETIEYLLAIGRKKLPLIKSMLDMRE